MTYIYLYELAPLVLPAVAEDVIISFFSKKKEKIYRYTSMSCPLSSSPRLQKTCRGVGMPFVSHTLYIHVLFSFLFGKKKKKCMTCRGVGMTFIHAYVYIYVYICIYIYMYYIYIYILYIYAYIYIHVYI